jgi:hypothetical protein
MTTKQPGQQGLTIQKTDADHDCDIAVYSDPHGMKQGVGFDESCEPEDFLLHFIDSKTTEKMKEQTNLHADRK